MLVEFNKEIAYLFLTLIFQPSSITQRFPDVGSGCQLNGGKEKGVCTPLNECQEAISNLKSGVDPTICQYKNRLAIVCCRKEIRISTKKCIEYLDVLKEQPIEPVPFLPFEFLENEPKPENKSFQCNNRLVQQFIVEGRDAEPDEFPHMVALGYKDESNRIWGCGGTLISPNFVLTAAHCLTNSLGKPTKALLGDVKTSSTNSKTRIIVDIEGYYNHPEFKQPSSYNDIALLKLEKSVKLSRSILPACLPEPKMRLDKHNKFIVAGWGRIGAFESQSEILQAVNLTRFKTSECNDYYDDLPSKQLKYPQGILRKQICAGDKEHKGRDSCQGDSGSGLVTNDLEKSCIYYVVGVTAFGSTFCGSASPGVYTNVQTYLDWIESVVWNEE